MHAGKWNLRKGRREWDLDVDMWGGTSLVDELFSDAESKVECEKQYKPEKLSLVGKLCRAIIEINGAKNKKFYED